MVSDVELGEWRALFELAIKHAPDIDKQLSLHYAIFKDPDWLKRLCAYVSFVLSD